MRKTKKKPIALVKRKRSTRAKIQHAKKADASYVRNIIVIFGVLFVMFVFTISYKLVDKPHILGTSIYLADQGTTNSVNDSTDDKTKTQGIPQQSFSSSGSGQNPSDSNSIVDCVGPDNKHFQTKLRDCYMLNKSWGQNKFNFTPLKPLPSGNPSFFTGSQSGKFRTPDFKKDSPGSRSADMPKNFVKNAPLFTKPHTQTGGKEQNDLESISKNLRELGIELESSHEGKINLRDNGVETTTRFPISVDPKTRVMMVTTPHGTKQVTILPNQAVQQMLINRVLDSVQTQGASDSAGVVNYAPQTTLTEVQDKPVFQIKGITNKKILGLFPVSLAKTVFVSTEDGKVVKTDETFFSKLLEGLSF